MRTLRDFLVGTACVAALIACGAWYARYPEGCSPCNAAGQVGPRAPISVNHIEWCADGHCLLALSRGDVDSGGPLVLSGRDGDRTPVELELFRDEQFTACSALAPDGLHVACG